MSWEVLLTDQFGQSHPRSIDWIGPATVSHLAAAASKPPHSCLRSIDRPNLHWSAGSALAAVPVRRGERLQLTSSCCSEDHLRANSPSSTAPRERAVDGRAIARIEVRSGPDAGRAFTVPLGSWSIGRGRPADFRLSDPTVSRASATIVASMAGQGSSLYVQPNGHSVEVNGVRITALAPLPHGSTIRLGATTLAVSMRIGPAETSGHGVEETAPDTHTSSGTHIPIERSAIHTVFDPPIELTIDPFPTRTTAQPFPVLTVAIGVAMAVALLGITPAGPFAVLYLMGPLMLVGAWAEQRRSSRRAYSEACLRWRERRDNSATQLRAAADSEARALDHRYPSSDEWTHEVIGRGPRVWECVPARGDPWAIRLGSGSGLAMSRARLASSIDPAEHRAEYEPLESARQLAHAPVVIDLSSHPHLAIVGADRLDVAACARSVVLQVAARFGPADAVLATCLGADELAEWSWLRWLPHSVSAESLIGEWPHARPELVDRWWAAIRRIRRVDSDDSDVGRAPRLVLIASERGQPSRAQLSAMLGPRRSSSTGSGGAVSLLWIGTDRSAVPSFVESMVLVGSGPEPDRVVGPSPVLSPGAASIHPGASRPSPPRSPTGTVADPPELLAPDETSRCSRSLTVDRTALAAAEQAALALAPTFDAEQPDRSTSMPRSIPIDSVQPRAWIQPLALAQAWMSRTPAGLAAPIGADAEHTVWLDVVADGPHALIAGTTGSGKSALLQTWCLSLALQHGPSRLNVLLIDYKGGAAFGPLEQLPHCVGSITNLGPAEVARTLDSLEAELTHRMRVLAAHAVPDIDSYFAVHDTQSAHDSESGHDPAPAPVPARAHDPAPVPGPAPTSPHPEPGQGVPLARLVVVVDEFAALAAERPEFLHSLVDLAARGRSLGIHLILATQRPRGVISDDIRANMALRISLRVTDIEESIDIIGDPSAASLDRGAPGRAIIRTRAGATQRIQVAHAHAPGVDRMRAAVTVAPLRLWNSGELGTIEPRGSAPAGTGDQQQQQRNGESGSHPTLAEQIVQCCVAAHAIAPVPIRRPCAEPIPEALSLPDLWQNWAAGAAGLVDRPDLQAITPFAWNPVDDGNMVILGPGRSGRTTAVRAVLGGAHSHCAASGQAFWVIDADGGLAELAQLPLISAYANAGDVLGVLRMLSHLEQQARQSECGHHHTLVIDNLPATTALLGRFGPAATEQIERLATTPRSAGVSLLITADRRTALPVRVWASAVTRIQLASPNVDDLLAADVDARLAPSLRSPGHATADGQHRLQFANAGARDVRELFGGREDLAHAARFVPPGTVSIASPGSTGWGFELISLQPAVPSSSAPVFVIFGPAGSGKSTALQREAERAASTGATPVPWQPALGERIRDHLRAPHQDHERPLVVLVDDAHLMGDAARRELTATMSASDPNQIRWIVAADSHRVHRFDESVRHWTRFRNGALLQPTLDRDGDLFDVVLPATAPCELAPGSGVLILPNRPPTFVQVYVPRRHGLSAIVATQSLDSGEAHSAQPDSGEHSPLQRQG